MAGEPMAAVGIGIKSILMVVARPKGNNRFEVLDREKEVVRLGAGSGDMKRLSPDAIGRGVSALRRFRQIAERAGAEIRAVATSAVREAENRDEFLQRARTDAGMEVAVGSSGTILNIAEMARAKRDEPPLQQVSGATVSADDVHRVVRALTKASTADERLAVPGLDPRRVDIIVGGALILEEAVTSLGIGELIVSDFALREGLLLDSIRRRDSTSIGHLRDLRYESVLHLAAITPGERDHANHATELALQLFEQTTSLHRLGGEAEEILEAAGLLANVGLFVAHDRHHLHSYYIIRHSDLLTGFTAHEVELIALVARYHRKSAPKPTHAEFASLSPADQELVRVLAGLLRLGFALDRTRAGAVKAVKAGVTPGRRPQLVLDLVTDGEDVELERYTSDDRKSLLESALGVSVVLAPA